ncbi:hypothetical protein [Inquilinus limosus]|uniref:Uncharacterized protein n=1 Tax=Inquilinus limosus MP06 TaxID=1398085 RepID=A0A0A0D7K8_9PROT|nr:hypothetical protein [Inquilinus limosus]KGM34666.1 hypothetical protein P409_08860 [Inquilinus limosus MP06]
MTGIDLDRLVELDRAASPGPWFVRHLDDDHAMSAIAVSIRPDSGEDGSMRDGTWPLDDVVAACLLQQPRYVDPPDQKWDENAALIAEVRTALPELLRLARIGQAQETSGRRPG